MTEVQNWVAGLAQCFELLACNKPVPLVPKSSLPAQIGEDNRGGNGKAVHLENGH